MSTKKILFLLGGSFPTPKAYGITTRETINVLIAESYDVNILSYKSNYYDSDFDSVVNIMHFYKINFITHYFRNISLLGKSRFHSILFRIVLFLDLSNNVKKIKFFNPDIIWTREPLYAFMCLKILKNIKIVLEVHEISNSFFFRILKKFSGQIIFCPINEPNLEFLNSIYSNNFSFVISPMGINKNHIASRAEVKNFVGSVKQIKNSNIKIGYVGKIRPTTYSKGVEDLISLAEYSQKYKFNMQVTLLGVMEEELKFLDQILLNKKITEPYLKILGHVSHSLALESLKNFDVLVLPAYTGSRYNGMPLKFLEYLASGKIVIFGRCALYEKIINKNVKIFFYEPLNIMNLYKSIMYAIEYEKLSNLILDGITFAKSFTWENRTMKILDNFL